MFDGSFKSRRTINLGGNKQQIDKQKLLKQAQEERRIREAERARLKAAERIQVQNYISYCMHTLFASSDEQLAQFNNNTFCFGKC